jgi:hypothetical protein
MEMEKRRTPRHRTLKAGKIAFNDMKSVIDCVVRNLTSQGAALQVASLAGIPSQFILVVDAQRRPCRVAWRQADRIGVEFIGEAHADSADRP